MMTPPRSVWFSVLLLVAASPDLQHSNTTSPYDDTEIHDNESVDSAYSPSEPEQGMLCCVLHIGHAELHFGQHEAV